MRAICTRPCNGKSPTDCTTLQLIALSRTTITPTKLRLIEIWYALLSNLHYRPDYRRSGLIQSLVEQTNTESSELGVVWRLFTTLIWPVMDPLVELCESAQITGCSIRLWIMYLRIVPYVKSLRGWNSQVQSNNVQTERKEKNEPTTERNHHAKCTRSIDRSLLILLALPC